MRPPFTYYFIPLTIGFSLVTSLCGAQEDSNLVFNGSFELRSIDINGDTICPGGSGQIGWTQGWNSAFGTVDYFNACSNDISPDFGVPQNMHGYQDAASGSSYTMLASFSTFWQNAREFLWQELDAPLITGRQYTVSFKVSLKDSANFAVDNIGVLFTMEDTRFWQKADFLNSIPQVESTNGQLLSDKENWVTVGGSFVANDNFLYLTLGTFKPDAAIWIEQVDSFPEHGNNWDVASYYIDDIELVDNGGVGLLEFHKYEIELYPNPASDQVTLGYEPSNARSMQWQVADMTGRVLHQQQLRSNERRASLGINLPSGIYLSTVIADGVAVSSLRLIVL